MFFRAGLGAGKPRTGRIYCLKHYCRWPITNNNHPHRSVEQVTARLDRLIADIRTRFHAPVIGKPTDKAGPGDVLLVAHGHILRAFAMRWAGKALSDGPIFLLEAGGVGTLRFVMLFLVDSSFDPDLFWV